MDAGGCGSAGRGLGVRLLHGPAVVGASQEPAGGDDNAGPLVLVARLGGRGTRATVPSRSDLLTGEHDRRTFVR